MTLLQWVRDLFHSRHEARSIESKSLRPPSNVADSTRPSTWRNRDSTPRTNRRKNRHYPPAPPPPAGHPRPTERSESRPPPDLTRQVVARQAGESGSRSVRWRESRACVSPRRNCCGPCPGSSRRPSAPVRPRPARDAPPHPIAQPLRRSALSAPARQPSAAGPKSTSPCMTLHSDSDFGAAAQCLAQAPATQKPPESKTEREGRPRTRRRTRSGDRRRPNERRPETRMARVRNRRSEEHTS